MRRSLASLFRIASRAGFLAVALFLGLIFWYLPSLLNFDAFRPELTDFLEKTFHCKVLVGNVTGQLVPAPGLMVQHVVFLEDMKAPSVLASINGVRLELSLRALLEKQLQIRTIRFLRPRFIVHRRQTSSGETQWTSLHLPAAEPSGKNEALQEWLIRNGTVELWDHTTSPTAKWVADQFNGSFQVHPQKGALAGKAARLGPRAILDIHYDGSAAFPVQAHLNDIELSAVQSLVHLNLPLFGGTADSLMKVRIHPSLEIRTTLDQPSGAGHAEMVAQADSHGHWTWSAEGKDAVLKGTSFWIPEWSAKTDNQTITAYARAQTHEGAMAEATWTQPAASKEAALEVTVSSVTLRQILEIFRPTSKPLTTAPRGYGSWLIDEGSMKATVRDGDSLDVQECGIDAQGMHLDVTGHFDLAKMPAGRQARIQGTLQNIPTDFFIESFFVPPSPLTGTGQVNFALTFPLSGDWVKGLNGTLQVDIDNGILRALKTIYRIMTVLNLGNYLRLRLPQVTAQGIVFESIMGHLLFQNGVLSSEDLFLKSSNMNVGAKGSVDIPGKRVQTTLRLEMFRFLEDILRDVPITHWIFKKPNKIFLPLVVVVEGPWDNLEIH